MSITKTIVFGHSEVLVIYLNYLQVNFVNFVKNLNFVCKELSIYVVYV